MTILSCLCFYSLYYHFVNLNFICDNNLYTRHSFHFTYKICKGKNNITSFEIIDKYISAKSSISSPLHQYIYIGYLEK